MPTDINLLIRGQSNAALFAAFGAADSLEQQLEARVPGVDIHLLAEYGTATSTMYPATGFLDWPRDGEQQGLLTFLRNAPADIRDNPTVTLWMHNEFDANTPGVTTGQWVNAVLADAAQVRDVLGQDAATTPYTFTWVNYPFTAAGSPQAIQAGMNQLSADPGFNARFDSTALNGLAMDGPGEPPGGHIGYGDAYAVAGRLADSMAGTVAALAGGGPGGGDTGGNRVWDFNAVADSPKAAPRTLDWQAGDKIDFSDVPLSGAGQPASLRWAGIDPEGSKAWGVWGWGDGSGTLRVDVDGDSSADMSITLRGAPVLTAGDFILA